MPICIPFTGVQTPAEQVKVSGGCHRFYQASLDKIWRQIRQGAFDL